MRYRRSSKLYRLFRDFWVGANRGNWLAEFIFLAEIGSSNNEKFSGYRRYRFEVFV